MTICDFYGCYCFLALTCWNLFCTGNLAVTTTPQEVTVIIRYPPCYKAGQPFPLRVQAFVRSFTFISQTWAWFWFFSFDLAKANKHDTFFTCSHSLCSHFTQTHLQIQHSKYFLTRTCLWPVILFSSPPTSRCLPAFPGYTKLEGSLPVYRRPSETGAQTALPCLLSWVVWLATLTRPTQCQSVSAEAACGLKRHQNIIVQPGCWVAGREMKEVHLQDPWRGVLCVWAWQVWQIGDGSEVLSPVLSL